MNINIALLTALCGTAIIGMSSPAAAQTYGGIALSFGSGSAYDSNDEYQNNYPNYNGYQYNQYYPNYDYYYSPPQTPQYNYDYYRALRQHQHDLERWNRERQREYARHERDEHRAWHQEREHYEHDDDDGD